MAYFLRQEKKKNRVYLQMYENYWDKECVFRFKSVAVPPKRSGVSLQTA